jgi:MFS family permease
MSYANLFGLFFLMPFVFIRIYHDSVLIAGVRLAIVPASLGLIAPISGTLSDRFGIRILTISGMVVCSIGLLLLYFTIDGNVDSLPTVMAALAIFGLGMGLFASPNNNAIMAAAPPHMTGTAGGLMNVIRSLGMSIGISAAAALMSSRLNVLTGKIANTIDVSPDILLHAGRGVIFLLIGFAVVGGFSSLAGVHAQQLPASTASSSKTA